jgi:hypothetical protein
MFEGNALLQLIERLRGTFISRDRSEKVLALSVGAAARAADTTALTVTDATYYTLHVGYGGVAGRALIWGDGGTSLGLGANGAEMVRLLAANRIYFLLSSVPVYANNAAAVAGGLTAGMLYRTGGDPDPVCIVH